MKKTIGLFIVFVCILIVANAFGVEKTSTGFYYPTGASNLTGNTGWLASGCNGNSNYFRNEYHIGQDIGVSLNATVYAIADGDVIVRSTSKTWGTGNLGILIKHRLADGSYFIALYGHIRSSLVVGSKVYAGQSFATIGPWSEGYHLHFGIIPSTTYPSGNWGRMPCSSWPSTNSFVDPISWIKTKTPFTVGLFSNMSNPTITQSVQDCYNREGGQASIGLPANISNGTIYVHYWNGAYVQDFKISQGKISSIVFNPDFNTAHLIRGGMRGWYFAHNSPAEIGTPCEKESGLLLYYGTRCGVKGDFGVMQRFSLNRIIHTLFWNSRTGVTVHQPVGMFRIESPVNGTAYIWENNSWKRWGSVIPFSTIFDAGDYQLSFRDQNNNSYGGFCLNILEGNHQSGAPVPPDIPSLSISVSSLDFGSSSTSKSFTIKNNGGGTLTGTISDDKNWISISLISFDLSAGQSKEITINVDRSSLSAGTNTGNVSISSNNGDANISIYVTKDSPPPPPPTPDPNPVPTSNTAQFTSSDRKLKLTGEFFNDYTKLVIAGGDLVLITKTISSGFEMAIPNGYTKINFIKVNSWYWHGKDNIALNLYGLEWNDEGWYWLKTSLPKLAQDSLESKCLSLKNYSLSQNYPNPFNPETVISFSIPQQEFVELKIFDILGNEIAILVNELMDEGEHKVIFNKQLSAGIYFYKIKAGKFIDTKKMIFAK